MADSTVSLAQLTAWLVRFETLLLESGASGPSLAQGMTAVRQKLADSPAPASVGELFTLVGMTLVGSPSGASGPLYGTFFLRFGMNAGATRDLDSASLGQALRAGQEGAVERGTAALGDTTMLDVLAQCVDAYDSAVTRGAEVAAAAASGVERNPLDAGAVQVGLLFEALATALAAG